MFTIYGPCGQLSHVTSIVSSDFNFLVPESFHKNLVQIGTVVSEKIRFEFLFVHDLGPRTSIISSDFHFFVLDSFHKKFGSDR